MNIKKPKQSSQMQQHQQSASQGPPAPSQPQSMDSSHNSGTATMLPSTKTQAQPTPMPSLSPVLAHSPAQSAGASPQPTSAKILQSQSSVLAQNSNWLAQASERIEKTIELINIKKIKEALQILLEINQVFESSGVCVSTTGGIDSTKSASPIPGSKPPDLSARRNKTSVQLAIITKYNLACCFQSLGESQKCIRYLQQASRQLSYYSNMDTPQGLFKVNVLNDKISSTKKGGGVITPADNEAQDSGVDFNEYNCVGASSSKGADNESADLQKQSHDQLSAQLQANRYLCKFHLQLCAIMSQLGQHVQANENGQQAAAIAEVILIKTNEFCQMSVEELFQRDNKFRSIIDQSDDKVDNTSRDDYQGMSLKSSMQTTQQKSQRKLTRGSSVTSLYSQEKERKSVSIRRSRSKANTMRGRDSSIAATSDETTQSLERMYTFNLSRVQKTTTKGKSVNGAKKDGPAGIPNGEDVIDVRPIDMQPKNEKKEPEGPQQTKASNNQNPEEEAKAGLKVEQRTTSQASRQMARSVNNPNFCPTYQVLERTNIQEKQILNVQPLLEEFKRVSEEFNQQNLTLDEAETHHKRAQFASLKEIQTLKANKRFKINVRNTLGVKDHNNWIYNLNIGNVMNLTPMNSDELNTQSDVFQELSKDTMLEKIILYVVAYFCVGTEIRFQATKMEKKESPQEYIKVWSSEMWHGKSLQVACLFLPEDCPLVDHIIKSYKKHYIGKQSLLSVVVQPKPRVKPQSQNQPTRIANSSYTETKPQTQKLDRPVSQQQISPPMNENLDSEKIRLRQNSPSQGERTSHLSCKDQSKFTGHNSAMNQQQTTSIPEGSGAEQHNAKFRHSHQAQPDKLAWTKTSGNREEEGPQPVSVSHSQKLSHKVTLTVQGGGANQLTNGHGAGKTHNSKQRQKTLKDMVFQNLKPTASTETKPLETSLGNPNSNTLMQYNKVPPKSPESPTASEPNGENQEAIVIFTKGVAKQRKLSRNKQTGSATVVGQEGENNGEAATNQGSNENNESQEPSRVIDQNQSPSVRRRAVQPLAQPRAASPRLEPKGIQMNIVNQEQKTDPVKKSRPYAQTITYNDIQRLQQNLNIQIQQNKQKAFKKAQNHKNQDVVSGLPEPESRLTLGDRPQSAQQSANMEGAAKTISSGSYQKRAENLAASGNNNSGSTPKRTSQVAGQSSHKRYQQQPSITSSLQKLVSKPGSKGQSKVLQSEALNPQAWPTVASSASSKQGKQKIIMLQKQKNKIIGQGAGSTALWLAQNPASDNLKSKHPIQIGTTKFVDNQLKLLAGNSNTSTARGSKKHQMGLSPKHGSEVSSSKKDTIIMESLRKKPMADLQRAYDTTPGVSSQAIAGLSKSIAKEKFHQANLIPHQPMVSPGQHKVQVHVFNNKLNNGQAGFSQQQSLKKSASTRQVVNLLDLQQPHLYSGAGANGKQLGQASQQLMSKHLHHVVNHPLGGVSAGKHGAGSSLVGSQKMSNQQVQSGTYKTLAKKHKNTKSTGLLHHHM